MLIVKLKHNNAPIRKLRYVESSPQGTHHPEMRSVKYLKPGDPLPQPTMAVIVVQANDTRVSGTALPVAGNLMPPAFSESGLLEVEVGATHFFVDFVSRSKKLRRVVAIHQRTGLETVVLEDDTSSSDTHCKFIDSTCGKLWHCWHKHELLFFSERSNLRLLQGAFDDERRCRWMEPTLFASLRWECTMSACSDCNHTGVLDSA